MVIGQGAKQLEQRIANALFSGSLYKAREIGLLQTISRRIDCYGGRAFISDDQAVWLFTILTRFEQGTHRRPVKARTRCETIAVPSANEAVIEGFDITEALEG